MITREIPIPISKFENVTHTLKSVKRHHIDLMLPDPPASDAEAVVLSFEGDDEIVLSPGNFHQLLCVLNDSWTQITGDPMPQPSIPLGSRVDSEGNVIELPPSLPFKAPAPRPSAPDSLRLHGQEAELPHKSPAPRQQAARLAFDQMGD